MAVMTHDRARVAGSGPGWVFALVSALSFGLSGVLGSALMDAGWSAAGAVAVRALIGGVALVPVAAVQMRGRWHQVGRHLPLIALYGAVPVAGCQLAYFTAVRHVPVGIALLIEYAAPVVVVGWLWLRRGQRPTRLTVAGAAIAAAGLLLVIDVGSGATSTVGVLWALVAMVGVACYFLMSSHKVEGLPGTVLATGGLLVGGVLLLLAGVVGLVPLTVSSAPVAFTAFTVAWWVPVVVLGVVTGAVAYGSGIAASRRLGARLASFVALSELVVALVFAALLLGQMPGPVQLVGGLLILAGVVAVRRGEFRP